ncbi:Fructosamine/Ketosamine-3-kinase [Parachaetomium inaequale]|uniref:protein-ribulosamine 3-kinase n=1 Tax=Parachaetomium inaequale TaxID=2588326 RepID=A0AAN6PKQ9_9PEZI|nr:Fructosamine/Ketosamine-3-kinase [Parachaetomium inaequale]
MLPNVDFAILEALGLEATSSKLVPHGGSGFSVSYKLIAAKDGQELAFFVKIGTGLKAEVMFRGEHTSLNALHAADPSLHLVPRSHAHGALRAPGKFFLAIDFLDLNSSAAGGTGLSLAAKLARLHTTPAPIPRGFSNPMFGFPVPTCCGATRQDNTWTESWADFYADRRLRAVLKVGGWTEEDRSKELGEAVERVAGVVVPRLLGDGHLKGVQPVVVHGDLWSGNHGTGRIAGKGGVEEVVFDPSCVYGHSEYELGIMRMFGGFGSAFWTEYESLVPKAEPEEEWEDRLALYELYHHLNHYALFGGAYRSSALSITRKLISKYGDASR